MWRIDRGASGWTVSAHTGEPATRVQSAWVDESGRLFLQACLASVGQALGLVHSLDMDAAADAVEAGCWEPQPCAFGELPGRFGYVLRPRPSHDT